MIRVNVRRIILKRNHASQTLNLTKRMVEIKISACRISQSSQSTNYSISCLRDKLAALLQLSCTIGIPSTNHYKNTTHSHLNKL